MVESVVADCMAAAFHFICQGRITQDIFTHHEKSGFRTEIIKSVKHEGRGFGHGTVVECQEYALAGIPVSGQTENRPGKEPPEPLWGSFNQHLASVIGSANLLLQLLVKTF